MPQGVPTSDVVGVADHGPGSNKVVPGLSQMECLGCRREPTDRVVGALDPDAPMRVGFADHSCEALLADVEGHERVRVRGDHVGAGVDERPVRPADPFRALEEGEGGPLGLAEGRAHHVELAAHAAIEDRDRHGGQCDADGVHGARRLGGMDALWNDDFHHSAVVALTGKREAYYSDTHGTPQELVSALRWGYLFQGQRYAWQKQRRGHPALDLPASAFVAYIENHDQVANSARGARLSERTSAGRLRAMTAVTLLAPSTPMLFQGQECASTKPFLYFADHEPDLAKAVRKGRAEFLRQFPSLDDDAVVASFDDPGARETFERCKLDPDELARREEWVSLHTDLLTLRRTEPAFAKARADRIAGAVLGPEAFVIRYFSEEGDRLLLANLGTDLTLSHVPEPLLASPKREPWKILWSSESLRYRGIGVAPVETDTGWSVPGHAAIVLG